MTPYATKFFGNIANTMLFLPKAKKIITMPIEGNDL